MGVPLVPVLSCLLYSACEDLGVKGLVGIGMLSFTVGVVWRTRKIEDGKEMSLEENRIAEEEHKSLVWFDVSASKVKQINNQLR